MIVYINTYVGNLTPITTFTDRAVPSVQTLRRGLQLTGLVYIFPLQLFYFTMANICAFQLNLKTCYRSTGLHVRWVFRDVVTDELAAEMWECRKAFQ